MFDSSVASAAAGSDRMDVRDKYKIEYYFIMLDTIIQDIDNRFNTCANEVVRQMSAMCVWKECQSDDTENIQQLATLYKLDSDVCADQFDLLRNDPSVEKNVTSLAHLVSHMYSHGLHDAYSVIYELASFLLTIPVSSAGCERAFSKLNLVKDELHSTMGDERLNSLMLWQ